MITSPGLSVFSLAEEFVVNTFMRLSDASIVAALRASNRFVCSQALRVVDGSRRFLSAVGVFTVLVSVPLLVEGQVDDSGETASATTHPAQDKGVAHDAGPGSCHEANALCVTLKIPDTLTTRPEALVVSLVAEDSEGVCAPHTVAPLRLERPSVQAGHALSVVLDAPVTGPHRLRAVLYMAGGGYESGSPVEGIDHVITSAQALDLTGEPLSVSEPFAFALSR